MNIRQPTIAVTYSWQHPYLAMKKGLVTHTALFERILETFLTVALLTLIAIAIYRLGEIFYLFQKIPPIILLDH